MLYESQEYNDLGTGMNAQMVHHEMKYLEGRRAYTGFCRAIRPAAVSLKVMKSSRNEQNGQSKTRLTHLTTCVRQPCSNRVRKDGSQLLVTVRSQPKSMSESVCVCLCRLNYSERRQTEVRSVTDQSQRAARG